MNHLVAVELQADQLLAHQRADKHVVLPGLEAVSVVERHAAEAGGLFPDVVRGDGAFGGLALGFRNRLAGIVDAMGCQRPAVVLATLDDVDFIAAPGDRVRFPRACRSRD